MTSFGRLSRASIGLRTFAAALLAAGGGFLLVDLTEDVYLRWDLSVSGRNTLDESVLDVLDQLPEPVVVDIFLRPFVPPYDGVCLEVARRLMEVLGVAEGARRGRIEVNVHDASDLEDSQARQRELGVDGVNLVVFSNASGTQKSVQTLLGDVSVIDWGQPTQEGLRYLAQQGVLVTSSVYGSRGGGFRPARVSSFRGEEVFAEAMLKISSVTQPRVYFSTGQGEPSLDGAESTDLAHLRRTLEQDGFEVLPWNPVTDPGVPADADVLSLVGATQALPPGTIEAIQAYVEAGGRVIAAPSLEEVERGDDGGIVELLRGYGMIAQPGIVCEPIIGLSGQKVWSSQACANLLIIENGLSASHPLTEPLRRRARHLRLWGSASFRRGALAAGGILLDLVNSSSDSWVDLPLAPGRFDYTFDSRQERRERRRLVMLAEFSASLNPEGSAVRRGRVLGVAGSNFFSNALIGDNRDFLLNAYNWMAERDYRLRVSPLPRSESRLDLARSNALPVLGRLLYLVLPGLCGVVGLGLAWRRRS